MIYAFYAGDVENIMTSYEKNSTIMFDPGKPVSDPKQLREGFKDFLLLAHHLNTEAMKYLLKMT